MNRLLSTFLLCTVAAGPAAAQAPTISGIFPPGGAAGSTVTASVSGGNLAEGLSVFAAQAHAGSES